MKTSMKKAQTTLSIDKETKRRAELVAKSMHLSLSGVARILLNDFADGKIKIATVIIEKDESGFTAAERAQLDATLAEVKAGRNLEGPFTTAVDLLKALKK